MTKKMQNTGEPMPNFFLVLDFVVFGPGVAVWTRVADPKCSSAIFFYCPLPNPYIMLAARMMDYT